MNSSALLGMAQLEKKTPRKRENLDHLSEKERVARRKITNRVSAQAARERKKMYITTLEQMVQNLKKENENIRSSSRQLEENLVCLRQENTRLRSTAAESTSMAHDCGISSEQRGNVAAAGSDSEVEDELMGYVPINGESVKCESAAETVHFADLLDGDAHGLPQLPCQPSHSSSRGSLSDLAGSESGPDAALDPGIDWDAELARCGTPIRDLLAGSEPFGGGQWSDSILSDSSSVRSLGACSPASACSSRDDEQPSSDSGCEMSPAQGEPLAGIDLFRQDPSFIDSLLQELNQSVSSPSSLSGCSGYDSPAVVLDNSSLTSLEFGQDGSPLSGDDVCLHPRESEEDEWLSNILNAK